MYIEASSLRGLEQIYLKRGAVKLNLSVNDKWTWQAGKGNVVGKETPQNYNKTTASISDKLYFCHRARWEL